jgi:hypothetical protein
MSASVSLNVEVPRNERKIDDEILQQILKETEDINLVNNNNTTIDIDNLMHTMLLEEVIQMNTTNCILLLKIEERKMFFRIDL